VGKHVHPGGNIAVFANVDAFWIGFIQVGLERDPARSVNIHSIYFGECPKLDVDEKKPYNISYSSHELNFIAASQLAFRI
jgi:hypothetical protein